MAPSEDATRVLTRELARLATVARRAHRLARDRLRAAKTEQAEDAVDGELLRLADLGAALAPSPSVAALDAQIARERAATLATRQAATDLPLYRLVARAELDELAFDLLLLALAPEVDMGFGRVFYLLRSGAATSQFVDVATAIQLLTPDDVAGAAVRRALGPEAPLRRLGLVELVGGDGRAEGVSLAGLLRVPSPVVACLFGLPVDDEALRAFVTIGGRVDSLEVPPDTAAALAACFDDPALLAILEGPAGSGRRDALRALAATRGRRLIEVAVGYRAEGLDDRERLAVRRLAWLLDATLVVVLPELEATDGREPTWRRGAAALLADYAGPIVIVRPEGLALPTLPTARRAVLVPFALPDAAARERLWRSTLGDGAVVDPAALARTYRMPPGEQLEATRAALLQASARGPGASPTMPDIIDAIDQRYAPRLQKVGRRLKTQHRLEDLVLETETRATLDEMEATVRNRHLVLDEWGFGRLVRGKGISALFYGEPGTGKTMAAGAIAASCGLALYLIDTAQVVSKWIGETEKNLGEVFRAAESSHAVLLFDEADAIFGKRTDVKTSTDRYANLQTNFLLSQIETFNGISILTTNRDSVMDPAFMRRIQFRVYFPMPELDERIDLWRRCLGGQDLSNIDLAALGERLVMSGGYIRNAVLRGAYLAAKEGRELATDLLHRAAELVLRDAGKVV